MFPHEFAPHAVSQEQARKKGALRPLRAEMVHRRFAEVQLFAGCSKRELRLLTKIAVVEPRAAGATLVTEGQAGACAYVILQGTCNVLRKGRRVGKVHEGGVVGELSMLNRAPRNATVVAETELEVAILERRDFLALLEESHSICRKLLESLAARVQELDARTTA
ncbi:MAG TPA: cyclic nucleotide-binding domain-containing protein [Acidimicrobiia bacterium]|jgi:CRP-like cAMP-binding protein|nr:cyclic nucleotide-binding domain-containing protein [Acidimicrobiia bacterium]